MLSCNMEYWFLNNSKIKLKPQVSTEEDSKGAIVWLSSPLS